MKIADREKLFTLLLREIKRHYKHVLLSVAIFGSYARGTATPASDLDVLIIAKNLPQGRMNRIREFMEVEERVFQSRLRLEGLELSPIFKTPREVENGSPLFWDMTEDVVLLYDRDDYLKGYLRKVKERLLQLKAKKVVMGNAWYWILKEDFTPGEIFEI